MDKNNSYINTAPAHFIAVLVGGITFTATQPFVEHVVAGFLDWQCVGCSGGKRCLLADTIQTAVIIATVPVLGLGPDAGNRTNDGSNGILARRPHTGSRDHVHGRLSFSFVLLDLEAIRKSLQEYLRSLSLNGFCEGTFLSKEFL